MVKINIGDIFGDYKILSRNYDKKAAATYWNCKCIHCCKTKVLRGDTVRKNPKCKCKYEDPLIGTFSNEFLILSKTEIKAKDKCNTFLCQCINCGNTEIIASNVLRLKRKHCSLCYIKHTTLIDLTGKTYGFLSVLERDQSSQHIGHEKDSYWICKCNNCGSLKTIRGFSLRGGKTKSCGCIKSYGEEEIAQLLINNNIIFQREYSFKDLKYINPLKFDFAIFQKDGILSHLIEYDGIQHFQSNDFFGGEKGFQEALLRDQMKNEYCIKNNIKLVRIKYDEKITFERVMRYAANNSSN